MSELDSEFNQGRVVNESTMEEAMLRCEGYCDLKMWTEARRELETLSPAQRENPAVLTMQMRVLIGLDDHDAAALIGRQLVERYPEKFAVLLLTAECLVKGKDCPAARAMLRQRLESHVNEPDMWLMLARVEIAMDDIASARQCVRRCVDLHPRGEAALQDLPELRFLLEE